MEDLSSLNDLVDIVALDGDEFSLKLYSIGRQRHRLDYGETERTDIDSAVLNGVKRQRLPFFRQRSKEKSMIVYSLAYCPIVDRQHWACLKSTQSLCTWRNTIVCDSFP